MRRLLAAAAAATLVIALTACGGESGGETAGLKTVKFGSVASAPIGALLLGEKQGFFKDEGIDVEYNFNVGGAAALPGVMAGDPQFATASPVNLLQAREQGLPVKIATAWTTDLLPPEDGLYGVVSLAGSDIKSLADLPGKSVAVNTLKSFGELTIREAVKKAGGDPDEVKFTELAFPDMAAALEAKNVDAIWLSEPFLTQVQDNKLGQLVSYTTQESLPGLGSYVFTSENLMKEDPELVEAMIRALNKTIEYAAEHTEEVKAASSEMTDIPIEVFNSSGMESFKTDLRTEQLKLVGDLMQQNGWIENPEDAISGILP